MTSKEQAVEALDEFISAMRVARAEMGKTEQFLRHVRQLVEDGESVESLIALMPPAEHRQTLADALDELNRRRHRARQKVFALALERGISVAELGRAWGFSRQLAARYISEEVGATPTADNGTSTDEVPTGP
jgi:hypothetical protein